MTDSLLESTYKEIYADSKVTPGEVMKLRRLVDEAEATLLEGKGKQGVVSATLKSFDVTRQLIQESLLKVRKSQDKEDLKSFVAVIQANLDLLKVNLDAFAD